MKKILSILFALSLVALLVFSASAQSYGSGDTYIPYLDFTIQADGYSIHSPAIKGSDGQSFINLVGDTDDLSDVSFIAQDVTLAPFENYTQAEARIYYDFVDALVNGESFRPTTFDINYSPFTIKYGDAFQYSNVQTGTSTVRFDAFTLYEAIGSDFEWYGALTAHVEAEVIFRVNYIKTQIADSAHSVYKYQPLTNVYSVSVIKDFNERFNASPITEADLIFRNETDGVSMSFNDFHNDVVSKTVVMRNANNHNDVGDVYIDVESCNVTIYAVNAPFSGLIQPYAPYIDVNGYDYVNALYWDSSEGAYAHRQQYRGNYVALITADVLNRRELSNIQFSEDSSPIVRVPALFLSAVSSFFDIDFFGLGFTIGNLLGVIALCAIVLIFLKMFAGG